MMYREKLMPGACASPFVSADLKGSQFSRFRCEPESLPVVVEHTNAAAAVEKQAVTIVSFFPASAG
jgi:hypothetical protein